MNYSFNFKVYSRGQHVSIRHPKLCLTPRLTGREFRSLFWDLLAGALKRSQPDSCALISHPWAQPNRWQHSALQGDLAIRGTRNWGERDIFLPEMMKQRRIDARWIRIYFFILHSLPLFLSLACSLNCLFRSLSVNRTSGGPFAVSVELRYNPLMHTAHPPNTLPTECVWTWVWMIHCL